MKAIQTLLAAGLLGAAPWVSAADLFLVIGNAAGRWPQNLPAAFSVKPDATPLPFDKQLPGVLAGERNAELLQAQSLGTVGALNVCTDTCEVSPLQFGPLPTFAQTWTALTKRPAHFVVRTQVQSSLMARAAAGNGYWSNFGGGDKGLFKAALDDFASAVALLESKSDTIDRKYVIWIQGELDAKAGISANDYYDKLQALKNALNDRARTFGNAKPFDGFFITSASYFYGADKASKDSLLEHRNKVHEMVLALDRAAGDPGFVLLSRTPRVSLSACFAGTGGPACESSDLLTPYTSTMERLGVEMALNAYAFHSTGVKPLLPSSCKAQPSLCAPSVDVYRWNAADGSATRYSTKATEFDNTKLVFAGVRFQLFQDPAPGRVALYSKWNRQLDQYTLSTQPGTDSAGFEQQALLGYCYAQPTPNAPTPLLHIQTASTHVVTRNAAERTALTNNSSAPLNTLCFSY